MPHPSHPACVCVCSCVHCMAWPVTFDPWPLISGSLRHSGRWGIQSVPHQFGLRYRKRRTGTHTFAHIPESLINLPPLLVFVSSLFLSVSVPFTTFDALSLSLSFPGKPYSWILTFSFFFPPILFSSLPFFLCFPGSLYPSRAPVEEIRHDGWRGFPHLSHLHGL